MSDGTESMGPVRGAFFLSLGNHSSAAEEKQSCQYWDGRGREEKVSI